MTQMFKKRLQRLTVVALLVTALSGSAQSVNLDNRIAPAASTPQQYADYYVLYVLTPSIREKLEETSAGDRPALAAKLNVWVGQVRDAIVDFETKCALTKEDAIVYLKRHNYDDRAIDVFNRSMSGSSAHDPERLEEDIANAVLDAMASHKNDGFRANMDVVLNSIQNVVHPTEIGRLNELFRTQDPLKFHHFPYLTVRWDFQRGQYAYASSKYTVDLDASTKERPAPSPACNQ